MLSDITDKDIEFKDYKKQSDIHGTALYPAVMIAPIQKKILKELLSEDNTIHTVFDPFHGSGTALYEASTLSSDIDVIGCDINPLANLFTRVKLEGIDIQHIYKDIDSLKSFINTSSTVQIEKLSFHKIEKWFKPDIIDALSLLKSAITNIKCKRNRLYFWYMLSDIIRKYSNTRSTTYKLHIRPQTMIDSLPSGDCLIEDYISRVEKNVNKFKYHTSKYKLYKEDILSKIKHFHSNNFDISITSPPYGDNATTVPYGQFSMLSLYIIDKKDLKLEGWELENYSIIDNHSLGGKKSKVVLSDFEKSLLEPYLSKIKESMHKKVITFFSDYFSFLKELVRVTNKYIIITLGHRTVDRVKINLTQITQDYLVQYHFNNILTRTRDIKKKRIPKVTSIVDDQPVSSMNKEYISIFQYQE